jgi:hypothetical protein
MWRTVAQNVTLPLGQHDTALAKRYLGLALDPTAWKKTISIDVLVITPENAMKYYFPESVF